MNRTYLYARVSTADQTLAHQQEQAAKAGFAIDSVITDEGVSGTTRFRDREGGKRLLNELRPGDTLVVRWLDRLGRNYVDVRDTVQELIAKGVTVKTVISGMTFDGATRNPIEMAVRDALLAFMAAIGQAQLEASKAAATAGIAHAHAEGKYLGRKPSFDRVQLNMILQGLADKDPASDTAKRADVSVWTVLRVQKDPSRAAKAITAWEHAAKERHRKAKRAA